MRTRFITAYILNLFDLIATLVLVKLYGVGVEANAFARLFIGDVWAVTAVKVVGVGILMLLIYRLKNRANRAANAASWICFAVYAAVAVYHLFIWRQLWTFSLAYLSF